MAYNYNRTSKPQQKKQMTADAPRSMAPGAGSGSDTMQNPGVFPGSTMALGAPTQNTNPTQVPQSMLAGLTSGSPSPMGNGPYQQATPAPGLYPGGIIPSGGGMTGPPGLPSGGGMQPVGGTYGGSATPNPPTTGGGPPTYSRLQGQAAEGLSNTLMGAMNPQQLAHAQNMGRITPQMFGINPNLTQAYNAAIPGYNATIPSAGQAPLQPLNQGVMNVNAILHGLLRNPQFMQAMQGLPGGTPNTPVSNVAQAHQAGQTPVQDYFRGLGRR